MKQNRNNYASHSIKVHYMAHRTNLAMQTLSRLPLMIRLENLLQTLHFYFAHSLKKTFGVHKTCKTHANKGE